MALERKLFLQCIDSPQRAGLIHAFFAEREVLKAPETKAAKPRAARVAPASSAAAPWARASRWRCSTPACR